MAWNFGLFLGVLDSSLFSSRTGCGSQEKELLGILFHQFLFFLDSWRDNRRDNAKRRLETYAVIVIAVTCSSSRFFLF